MSKRNPKLGKFRIWKLQRDMTGESILFYMRGKKGARELRGETAVEVAEQIGLAPLGKQFWRARVTNKGHMELDRELPNPGW